MVNKKQNKLTELKNKDICKKYIIYIVKNYGEATKEYISKNEIIFTNLLLFSEKLYLQKTKMSIYYH